MKGIILAAGRGARLNGTSADMPKCLVTLGGETLLARNIRVLRAAGVTDIVVVVGCAAATVRRSCPDVTFVEFIRSSSSTCCRRATRTRCSSRTATTTRRTATRK
jgi:choline kinase